MIEWDCKVVPRQRNGGCVSRENFKGIVPQEAKVTATAEEDVEENVEGDEHGQSSVQHSACARRLVQRRHVAQSAHMLWCRRGRGVEATEPVEESPHVVPLPRHPVWHVIHVLVETDHRYSS